MDASAGWNQWSLLSSTMQNYNSDKWGFEGILKDSNEVKVLGIISLFFFLLGCAPSTPDLIEQAHLTGDWSLVNARMEAIERREAREPKACPRGATRLCNKRYGDNRCSCIRNSDVRQILRDAGL